MFKKNIYIILFISIIGFFWGIDSFLNSNMFTIKGFFYLIKKEPIKLVNNFFNKQAPTDTLFLNFSEKKLKKFKDSRINKFKKIIDGDFNNLKENKYIKCKTSFLNNIDINSRAKSIGITLEHILNPEKWSFRLKLKGNYHFRNTRQFNLLIPRTRGFLLNYTVNKIAMDFDMIGIEYLPISVYINDKNKGIFLFEDFFNKYLIEKNRKKDSMIFTINEDKIDLNHPSKSKTTLVQKKIIKSLESRLNHNYELIDKNKLLVTLAISYILNSNHHLSVDNLHWYYNPYTDLLEPIIRETDVRTNQNTIELLNETKIIDFFKKNTFSINSLLNKYLDNYIFDSNFYNDFLDILFQVVEKFEFYYKSDQFLEFSKILNSETIINDQYTKVAMENNLLFRNEFRNKSYSINGNFNFIEIDTIYFKQDTIIDSNLYISKNEILIINEGVLIQFKNNSNVIIRGGLIMNGSILNPILVENIDSTSSSIIILESLQKNKVNHTTFKNLSSLNFKNWINSGTITVYQSEIDFYNSTFLNNLNGDDFLNIVRSSSFSINDCFFYNIKSDALDLDFSAGDVVNTRFEMIGNDGIDCSNSDIKILNSYINKSNDKAISCGEKSNITIKKTKVSDSYIGIASKDLTLVQSFNNSFINNTFDITVYQKKPEYGFSIFNDFNSKGIKIVLKDYKSIFTSDYTFEDIYEYENLNDELVKQRDKNFSY